MSNLLIIGHRGASKAAPENTMPAFHLAAQSGAQMVELDVQLSKDGRVVVIHDETLERTTTGKGPVSTHTLASLRKLDAGAWFGPGFKGIKIPTLEESLVSLPQQIGLNIELKNNVNPYPGIENQILSLITKYRARYRVIVSSFNWASLIHLHRLDPRLRLGLLFTQVNKDLWMTAGLLNAFSLHPPVALTNPQLVWQAHSWGYRIYPWVVNDPCQVLELKKMEVDGVFTDSPQTIARALE